MNAKKILTKDGPKGQEHLQPEGVRYSYCGRVPAKDQAAERAGRAKAAGVELAALELVTCPICRAYDEGDDDTRPFARTEEDRAAEGREE